MLSASDDPLMAEITATIARMQSGDRDGARARFLTLWDEIGPKGDPFHRCTLAHYMADLQSDPREELAWDLRALAAADSLTDARVKQHHATMALQAFYPSLHLNVAAAYAKVGNQDQAREQLVLAERALDALPDDGYGRMIRGGIERLAEQLAQADNSP